VAYGLHDQEPPLVAALALGWCETAGGGWVEWAGGGKRKPDRWGMRKTPNWKMVILTTEGVELALRLEAAS
jgi:hypothetical protein